MALLLCSNVFLIYLPATKDQTKWKYSRQQKQRCISEALSPRSRARVELSKKSKKNPPHFFNTKCLHYKCRNKSQSWHQRAGRGIRSQANELVQTACQPGRRREAGFRNTAKCGVTDLASGGQDEGQPGRERQRETNTSASRQWCDKVCHRLPINL